MSDRLLEFSAVAPLRGKPPAAVWRAMVVALRAVVTRRAAADLAKVQSAGMGPDHAPFGLKWEGGQAWPPRASGGLRLRLRAGWRRYRSRQRIAELDGHALKDIGVTYAEAEAEANKPFWVA